MDPWQYIIVAVIGALITSPMWMPANLKDRIQKLRESELAVAASTTMPTRQRRNHADIDEIRLRVANLLLACERLLEGDTPQDTIMYRLFEAHGGTADPVRTLSVEEWLRRSQVAMEQVYALRSALLVPETEGARSSTQLLKDWESLYVTLVGSDTKVLNLTDGQLHALLDPIEILEPEPEDVQLASQLNIIHDEMRRRPLKIKLTHVNPADFDKKGIIGYLEMVESYIAEQQRDSHLNQQISTDSNANDTQLEENEQRAQQRRERLSHRPDPHSGLPNRMLTLSERLAQIKEQSEEL